MEKISGCVCVAPSGRSMGRDGRVDVARPGIEEYICWRLEGKDKLTVGLELAYP